jgi:alpha-D-ribose 1-methylphosphonate 5-triphosphate synthase subunit PhnG
VKLLEKRRSLAARKAAATKVDFFTLVRGEND